MVVVWRAQLSVFDDWNLYAIAAPPLILLVVSGLRRVSAPWMTAFVVLAGDPGVGLGAGEPRVVRPPVPL
jgi:hypothetical protein